jgi:hypothetical protein
MVPGANDSQCLDRGAAFAAPSAWRVFARATSQPVNDPLNP